MGLNQKKPKTLSTPTQHSNEAPTIKTNATHKAPPNQCTKNQNNKVSDFSPLLSYAPTKYKHCSFQDQAAAVNTSPHDVFSHH
jgi:hypothetical protein